MKNNILLILLLSTFWGCAPPDPTPEEQVRDYCLESGLIDYEIPSDFMLGKHERVIVKIKKQIINEAKKIKIKHTGMELLERWTKDQHNKEDDKIVIVGGDINISKSAKVNLVSPDESAFGIKLLTEEWQMIDSLDYTTWEWDINPVESGKFPLIITVTSKVFDGVDRNIRQIKVFEKEVIVNNNAAFSIASFWKKNWQWIITAIAFPFLLWFRSEYISRRKRKLNILKPSTAEKPKK